jgi:hypothetical protein
METKQIKILVKFNNQYEVGDILTIDVDESGQPVSPLWRRFLYEDLKYVGWHKEPVKKKTTKQSANVDETGDKE